MEAVVKDFFRSGKLFKQVNNTIISLVPKSSCLNTVGDYRPISCCNVLYKIIAKIMADRLALVLPDIISMNQGAFVKNMSIMENILIFQDLSRNYHREGVVLDACLNLISRKHMIL